MDNKNSVLLDGFGRKHDYLRISLTERCNLRCFYCMPEEGIALRDKTHFMSTEELLYIAKTFVQFGVKKIRLTGGEPLLKKDFLSIIEGLATMPIEIAITSNGVLIDQYIEDFKRLGIKKLNISLDSLNEEKFNRISRRTYFQKIMENIRLLIKENFDLKVNVVLIKGINDDEIIDFIQWTQNEKVKIRFIEFMPFDGNKWDFSKQISFKEIIDKTSQFFGKENVVPLEIIANETSKNFKIVGSKGDFGIISSITNPFCDTCNRIRLTADGKLKNCLFSGEETDLLSSLRKGMDINSLIIQNIQNKKKQRANVFDENNLISKEYKNRSMVTIGG
ncbi:MAG: GTP 3',8-cyclase MoaA [Flavobacteriia bacterium]|nr:GTP 3',8-cyclase MoaA [Flavobacteriia bacterium]